MMFTFLRNVVPIATPANSHRRPAEIGMGDVGCQEVGISMTFCGLKRDATIFKFSDFGIAPRRVSQTFEGR